MIAYIAYFAYSAKFAKSLRKVCAVLTIYTLRIVRYDKGTTKKAADQGKEENDMKNWTLEDLYELWRDRGYSKKQAKAMAEKDFNEMHRKKSDIETHQIMQEMVYN